MHKFFKKPLIFFAYQNSFAIMKQKLFQESSSSALQQSINWIKFMKCDWNIIQEGEVIFNKNPAVGLLVVSKLIDLA